jgi:ribose-phosphate pyrophosphokinase
MRQIRIFSGSSHPELASLILARLGLPSAPAYLKKFKNSEISVELETSVRDHDVFIIQSASSSVHDSIMELLITINACRLASAARITAVVPCFPYNKQSKKKSRSGITCKCKNCHN